MKKIQKLYKEIIDYYEKNIPIELRLLTLFNIACFLATIFMICKYGKLN